MYQIRKLTLVDNIFTHEPYATAPTVQAAKDLLPSIVCMEEDRDYPNNFDVFTIGGDVFTIEPMGA